MSNGFADRFRSLQRGELPLAGLVTAQEILEACQHAGYRTRATLYTPVSVVLTFLAQLIVADRSCQQAVNGVVAHQVANGRKKPSADTGGYCKARGNLPEEVFWELARRSGQQAEAAAESTRHWLGRRVRIVDGSTLRIADTAKNRSEYPLQRNLKPGLHYPVVRILVIFLLAVGTVLDGALRPYQGKGTGETGMLRDLADLLRPGDVLLGDRYFSGYWDMAFWLARGVDVVCCISVMHRMTISCEIEGQHLRWHQAMHDLLQLVSPPQQSTHWQRLLAPHLALTSHLLPPGRSVLLFSFFHREHLPAAGGEPGLWSLCIANVWNFRTMRGFQDVCNTWVVAGTNRPHRVVARFQFPPAGTLKG